MASVPTPQNFSAGAVSGDVNAAKAATLQALAAGGSAAAERIATAQQYAQQQGGANAAAFASILGQSGSAQQNFYNSVGGNVSQYSDQVNQAIPLEQEITGQQLNSLHAVAQEREAQRQQQMQLGALQLQEAQARLEATRAAAAAAHDPNSLDTQLKQQQLTDDQTLNNDRKAAAALPGYDQQALDQLLGEMGPDTQAAKAIAAALSNKGRDDMGTGMAALDALITPQTSVSGGKASTTLAYHTPHGQQLDNNYMTDKLRRYYAIRQALISGQPVPGFAGDNIGDTSSSTVGRSGRM